VLLTSSIGAWIADQYTARWSDDFAGLVLVDPTNLSRWPKIEETPTVDGDDDSGCIRLGADASYAELAGLSPSSAPHSWSPRWGPLDPTSPEVPVVRTAHPRRGRPAGLPARMGPAAGAQHVVADTAGHFVQRGQPDLLAHVAHVVRAVLDAARTGHALKLTPADIEPVGGRLRVTEW
jgi:pimeloyl-ACP methyl ester carboxylesterase